MPMKKSGEPSSGGSSQSSGQPGMSKAALEEVHQCPPSEETHEVASVSSQPKKTSYSTELFSTWRDIRWYQIPLSSLRRPKTGLFSFTFQSSLQEYQQLRKTKRLKVGRPFSVLPLPSLPSMLTDCCQEKSHKRHDNRGRPRAKDSKGLSSHRGEPRAFSRQMHTRFHKCRSSTHSLPKRYIFFSEPPGQKMGEKPSSSSRKKRKQVDPGRSKQLLSSDAPGLACLLPPGCPPSGAAGNSDGSSVAGDAGSPLEVEEDMFPPDWTPPRVEFLYDEDLPTLSPAPGPASKYRSSGEMPDLTDRPAGAQAVEFTTRASSPLGGRLRFLGEPGILQPKELESGDVARAERSVPDFHQVAEEELEESVLEGQTEANDRRAVDSEGSPPSPFPIRLLSEPPAFFARSNLSTSSDTFSGDPESDVAEDPGPEWLPPLLPMELPTSPSSISRRSLSTSSDELLGDPGRLALDPDTEEDMDLVPLGVLLRMGGTSPSPPELSTVPSSEPGCYLSSLDKLLEEKRAQIRENEELERSLGEKLLLSTSLSSSEAAGENEAAFPEAHRLFLERFSVIRGTIPAAHPGESIFVLSPYQRTVVTLDTTGLKPQNQLENLFFSSQFTHQMALLQDGFLASLYRGAPRCPHPVLHWLFQLMSLNPDVSADAFQALWEITTHRIMSADKASTDLWCPALKDITQAFYNLGASASPLYPAELVEAEFKPKDLEEKTFLVAVPQLRNILLKEVRLLLTLFSSRFSGHLGFAPEENPRQLTLAAVLGDIFKFLALCVASHPHCYPDRQRSALLALLCRLSLDRNLRKQPQMELQQLLLVLLEGIQDWPEKLPELCRSLCHVSRHHHNLVAVMRSFPDTTDRGRQLRRNLSLCFITKLLGKVQMATSHWQEEIQEWRPELRTQRSKCGRTVDLYKGRRAPVPATSGWKRSWSWDQEPKSWSWNSPSEDDILSGMLSCGVPARQLRQLGHLLPLMKPALLKQGLQQEQRFQEQLERDRQEALSELDQEACYLCYSLLILANVVVGTKAVPSREQVREQGHLQHLCIQLQRHISASVREHPCLMYRTELKDLAAQIYIKWQELLSRGWLHLTPLQGQNENI